MPDPSVYTNYINVHLSIDKLDGTNYDTWAPDIKLWHKSQGYVDHLTHHTVAENEVFRWLKIDAQLCIVIKSTIHSSLKQIFHTYETCSKVWEQAKSPSCYWVYMAFLIIIITFVIKFWDLLSCSILLPLVLTFLL